MSSQPDWLSPLILFESCSGDWNVYLHTVYRCFVQDFIHNRVYFNGLPLSLRRQPIIRDKEASFWHLVSEGNKEEDRLPDIRRCERICWPRAIIENLHDTRIKQWKNDRQGQTNVCLWLEEQDYIVILGERAGYNLLLTAYMVTRDHSRRKLHKEYEDYIRRQ